MKITKNFFNSDNNCFEDKFRALLESELHNIVDSLLDELDNDAKNTTLGVA